jgi:hypothetical protein
VCRRCGGGGQCGVGADGLEEDRRRPAGCISHVQGLPGVMEDSGRRRLLGAEGSGRHVAQAGAVAQAVVVWARLLGELRKKAQA